MGFIIAQNNRRCSGASCGGQRPQDS